VKIIVLAAGYATRLYPLTLTCPKPLLPVAGQPMIDYVLDHLAPIGGIDRIYIVTNARFAGQFQKWADDNRARKRKFDLTIVNDHSTDEKNKLGALGDLHLVISRENLDDDLIVVAADRSSTTTAILVSSGLTEKKLTVVAPPGTVVTSVAPDGATTIRILVSPSRK